MTTPVSPAKLDRETLREEIEKKYCEVALNPEEGVHFHVGRPLAAMLGYDTTDVDWLPEGTVKSFAGMGNPLGMGAPKPGSTIVDVGCGASFDILLAAKAAGPDSTVIAIDMIPEMIEKTAQGAAELGLTNVETRHGYAEELPLDDNTADLLISNGVINLTPDKLVTLREIARVVKPGGRIQIADIVVGRPVPQDAKDDIELWFG
jgi:arsenite methyltransferase